MKSPQNFNQKLIWISALSTIGSIISIWQTRLYFVTRSGMSDGHSFCNIGQTFDCTAIEMSRYSEFLGGIPLSGFAISGYLLILILALYGFSESVRKNIRQILLIFTGVAVLFSLVYLAIMLGQIGKICLICLGVDSINLALFGLAWSLPKPDSSTSTGSGLGLGKLAGAGIVALMIAFLASKAANPQDGMKKEDMNDIVESVLTSPVNTFSIPADAPSIGNPNAPITIVKFSDYQCPACRMAANAVHPLLKRYPNDIRFVFVNFPLSPECNTDPRLKQTVHEFACEAATVAVCATQQGKFPEAYDTLFANQKDFEVGKIADLFADKAPGVDLGKLKECMKLPSTIEKIKSDTSVGVSLHIESTPTFFINGKKLEGGLPTNIWIELIDKMLKK